MRKINRTPRTHRKSPTFVVSFLGLAPQAPPTSAPTEPWSADRWQTAGFSADFYRNLLAPAA